MCIALPSARRKLQARLAAAGVLMREAELGPMCEDPSGNALLLAVA